MTTTISPTRPAAGPRLLGEISLWIKSLEGKRWFWHRCYL
jgi:hypothetical protein